MRGIFVLSIIIAISVMRSESLSQNDTGVCSETKTINAMTTETFTVTYTRSETTCHIIIILPICSPRYSIALRTRSRTVYREVETDVLTCCPGYVEVEDQCMSEATTKVITTQSPQTTSASSTSPASSLSSSSTEKSIFVNSPAKNKLSSFTITLIISGVACFAIVVIISVLSLCVFAVMRKQRVRRPQITSSQPQREERKNNPAPDAQYYTDIPENEIGYSAVVLGAAPQHSTLERKNNPAPDAQYYTDIPENEIGCSAVVLGAAPQQSRLSTISKQPKEDKTKTVKKSELTYKDRERQQKPGTDNPKHYGKVKPQSKGDKRYSKVTRAERSPKKTYYDELDLSYDLKTNHKRIYE